MKEILIKKYMAGTATHQEERDLLLLLQAEEHPDAESQVILDMLEMTADEMEPQEHWMEEDESALFDQMMTEQTHSAASETPLSHKPAVSLFNPPRVARRIALRIIASAALLTGVIFATKPFWHEDGDTAVTYIYGSKVEDTSIALEMMQETMGDLFDRPDVESELTDIFN